MQTEITPKIKDIANELKDKNEMDTIQNIIKWIRKNIKVKNNFAGKRTRTAEQIINSKIATGCIDIALIFIVIVKAAGLKANFIETLKKDWLNSKENKNLIEGHIFSKVLINNKYYIINPIEGTISEKGIFIHKNKEYIKIKEGLDSWDIGFRNNEDLKRFLEKEYKMKFEK